jgi:acetylglutamate kinase
MSDIEESNKPLFLFKYGGNAMTNENLKKQILKSICDLKSKNYDVVIVHGGGPFIKEALTEAKIESEFIDGHRKTSLKAFEYVEKALKGKVNSNLVGIINSLGHRAVGLSGKDGKTVIAKKRFHKKIIKGKEEQIDLGQVGDVDKVNSDLINLLLKNDFIPVISCIASDNEGNGFNINGDMFAGNVAGALGADQYVILTDVDGLLLDIKNPNSLIKELKIEEIEELINNKTIAGGMIPKIDSCKIALKTGAKAARIINGTKAEQIESLLSNDAAGSLILK